MPYIQLSSCNEGQEDLSLQCVGIGKGDLLSLFQKNLDFIYSLCDCAPGTVPQPCDIGLPVSVHNEQGQQFQIVLRQFAEPPVQQFILQGGQPAKPPGIHIAGVPSAGQGFKFSEQAGLLALVLTLFAGKGLYAVLIGPLAAKPGPVIFLHGRDLPIVHTGCAVFLFQPGSFCIKLPFLISIVKAHSFPPFRFRRG